MSQFQLCTFYIQKFLLILSHAINLFIWIGLKTHSQLIISANDRLKLSGFYFQRAAGVCKHVLPVPHIFLQEQLSLLIVEADLSNIVDHCFDLSVCDLSTEFMNGNFGIIPFRFPIQSPKLLGHLGHLGSPDSEAVGSPGFHDHPLCIIAVMQGIVLYLKIP